MIIRNKDDYNDFIRSDTSIKAHAIEEIIGIINRNNSDEWSVPGYCEVCQKNVYFKANWLYSDGVTPNYREHLGCPNCGLNNRQRLVFSFINSLKPKYIYCLEQVTNFYKQLKNHYPETIGSEYLGMYPKGAIVNDIRNESIMDLSFETDTFDCVVSNDVFEHIRDIGQALRECYRVLKPKGSLVFTAPMENTDKTVQRAYETGGQIQHLKEPVYHGNPVNENGSLVYYDFGWDLLDFMREAGFKNVSVRMAVNGFLTANYSNVILFYGEK